MRRPADQSRETLLQDFVTWCATNITGDEKGQAQTFVDHPFRAFGQKGSLDVGTAEMRIRKSSEDGHASTQSYPGAPGRPRYVQLARVLKKTGSFYYHENSALA
jgi:hypothetical protein